ncbi:rhamnulokinase [Streptomyces sp. 3MP-14]|uniref:Rhamnulokinase n=1 Tax=Streptomyces mimosae TaxID=2586635 RepID=A0A5N6A2P4_9ACTN|nr:MULTISPECIES: rhamnulokinase family protein [Streptomyces]KAB8163054.1 rhamnulokinase [Streptomyces mimosae]KAB8179303.1 rhamnulokinase [Streptomyces sp. 3MP-14]
MLGWVRGPDGSDGERAGGAVELAEVHRFPNRPVRVAGTLHWDVLALYRGVLDGLAEAGRRAGGRLAGVGIDSWAVDFGLLDASGALLGNPVHYRDGRTAGVAERVARRVGAAELYRATGLRALPFNTVYQLVAMEGSPQRAAARRLLLMPDLIAYWLTGVAGTELTNASTTGLIDPRTGDWAWGVAEALGIDVGLFPPLRRPGAAAGELLPEVLDECGLAGPVPVTAVGSHDTASAVVGVPAAGDGFAYVATGTWSLAGLELPAPVLSEASRLADFTNELGVDGTVRYLRNIMGLWLLQECLREWAEGGVEPELGPLLAEAARLPGPGPVVDAGGEEFLAPGGMPGRIAAACRRSGQPEPVGRAGMVRCVLDSLALAHREAVAEAARLAGVEVRVVHVVGGGAHNALLCQLTADACGLPVVAGPTEAASLGNVLVQARAAGRARGGLGSLRSLVAASQAPLRFAPRGERRAAWELAARRVAGGGRS